MQTAYLDTFLKTVESRSFTLAAKQLFITQQAVSKQVACLEKELQATLVERTTPLRLTPKGRIVARYAGAMLQLLQDIHRVPIMDVNRGPGYVRRFGQLFYGNIVQGLSDQQFPKRSRQGLLGALRHTPPHLSPSNLS